MRLRIMGANERLRFIFKLVVCWSIGIVIFLGGTFYGRWLERVCWEQALNEVVTEYQTLEILERIIKLESGGRHNAFGANGERGILQFKKSTFEWMADLSGMKDLRWENQIDQIILANWAIRNNLVSHWSTFRKIEK